MQLIKMIFVIKYNQMLNKINFFEYNRPLSFASKMQFSAPENRIQSPPHPTFRKIVK